MKTSIENLETKGFVNVTNPVDLSRSVTAATERWQEFCGLSTDIKKSLPYSNSGTGVGYELKEGVGYKADRKENFDIALGGREWLENNISKIENPLVISFLNEALSLVEIMKPLVLDFAKQVEGEFSLDGFVDEVESSEDAFFVRFIHYFGDREIGEETATAHVDQSGFTLHLFESDPGLQCLTFDEKWIDMPVSDGQTVIIPSMQLQLRSKGILRALCHRVIANENTAKHGRFSAVCFVQLKHTPKYDKERWGRLQERNPGFNYVVKYKEFKNLFR
jgi:isopenicillin N synthase-like dioxygenase